MERVMTYDRNARPRQIRLEMKQRKSPLFLNFFPEYFSTKTSARPGTRYIAGGNQLFIAPLIVTRPEKKKKNAKKKLNSPTQNVSSVWLFLIESEWQIRQHGSGEKIGIYAFYQSLFCHRRHCEKKIVEWELNPDAEVETRGATNLTERWLIESFFNV